MDAKDYTKQIELHKLADLHIDEELIFFEKQPHVEEQSLEISMEDRGNRSLYTAIRRDDRLILIDGIRRHPIELNLLGPDHSVMVFVVQEEMTDDDVRWYRIDRSKNKKKLKVDIVSEYKFRDMHMPSNQGKKDGDEEYRRKRIAKEIGVSTSTLAELLRIDRIKPSILHAVDRGERTMSQAKQDAKLIEQKRAEEEMEVEENNSPSKPITPDLNIANKHVDLNAIPTHCPCCNRAYSTLTWQEIPEVFNVKRKEDESQTDWLKSVA